MSEQDNVFPFGKFDGYDSEKYDPMVAVLNGLQRNMMIVLQKIDVLEHKIKLLEENHGQ